MNLISCLSFPIYRFIRLIRESAYWYPLHIFKRILLSLPKRSHKPAILSLSLNHDKTKHLGIKVDKHEIWLEVSSCWKSELKEPVWITKMKGRTMPNKALVSKSRANKRTDWEAAGLSTQNHHFCRKPIKFINNQ